MNDVSSWCADILLYFGVTLLWKILRDLSIDDNFQAFSNSTYMNNSLLPI